MAHHLFKLAVLSSLTVTLVGCGGSDDDDTTTGNGGVASQPAENGGAGGTPAAGPNMQATPEETFKNFKAAMVKDDWGEALQYIADDSQDFLVGVMIFGASMGVGLGGDEEQQKSFENLLKEHGVKTDEDESAGPPAGGPEAAMKEMMAGVKDKGACLNAVMEWAKKNLQSEKDDSPIERLKKAELGELKTDGDKATAMVDGEPMIFVKVESKWYIDMIAGQKASAPGGGPAIPTEDPGGDVPTEDPGSAEEPTEDPATPEAPNP